MNTDHYTHSLDGTANVVPVAEFRNQIRMLEDVVNRDWHSCVGAFEQANCIEVAKRVGAELIEMVCKRATVADMDRRERAIDRSTQLIARGVTWVDRVAKTAPKAPSMPANCKVVSLLDYLRR